MMVHACKSVRIDHLRREPETRSKPDMTYEGRIFRSVANSEGGDVGQEATFHYRQEGQVVWATYSGGSVLFGTLLAKADDAGNLDMRYQHLTRDGGFKTGRCQSRPELLPDGRLRLHESWEWTGGAEGAGTSIVQEIAGAGSRRS